MCEACWALHSGDAQYRPTGMRSLWLEGFACDEATWASLQIPIGLAFFMRSSVSGSVVGFYPSPAGATESELPLDSWKALVAANPVLTRLDADSEALVVNRLSDPPQYAILPIDRCYELVGLIRTRWEGISGGDALAEAVPAFFERVRRQATPPPDGVGAHEHRERRATRRAAWIPAPALEITGAAHVPFSAAPTMRFRGARPGARRDPGPVDRALGAGDDRPGAARLRPGDPGAPRRAVRLRPSGGRASTSGLAWARVAVTVPGFAGEARVRDRGPVHLRPRGGRREVLLRARRTGSCRSPSTSTATSSTATAKAACR